MNKKHLISTLLFPALFVFSIGAFLSAPQEVHASTHLKTCKPGTAQSMQLIHIGGSEYKATGIWIHVRMLGGVYKPNQPISVSGYMGSDDAPRACPGLFVNNVSFFPSSGCTLQAGRQDTKVVGNAPSTPGTYSMWWRVTNTWPNYTQQRICPMTYTVVEPAPTVTFSAAPTAIDYGDTSTLTWSSQNATSCSGDGKDGFYTGGKTSGSKKVSPSSNRTYTVTCTGSGGTVSKTATVTVNNPGPSASLSASPASITQGDTSTLTWSSQNATSCSGSGFSTGGATSGTRSVSPNNTTTYTVTCTDTNDNSASDNARVTVGSDNGTTGSPPGGGGGSQCSDGVDNDSDGLIDNADPDCSGGGTSENTSNLITPECSDGIDNDSDGRVDFPDDRACPSPEGDEETAPDAILSLSASPSPTRKFSSTTLSWEVFSGESCTLSGNNGDSWILTGTSGSQVSSTLDQETIFTLRCLNLDDIPFSTSLTVKLLPSFNEE